MHRTPGRAKRRLTVNYGVRWEPYQAPTSKWGQIHFFDAKLFDQGYRTPVYTNAPPGVIFPGRSELRVRKELRMQQVGQLLPACWVCVRS